MTYLIIQRRVNGFEMWQVYSNAGFHGQYFSVNGAQHRVNEMKARG